MEDKARFVAVSTLYDIETQGAYSNIKSNSYFREYDLSSIDRAFATEIIYGTIRWKLKIDYCIQKFTMTKIQDISTWALICIRTAIYQVFFMDKVPESAAVNVAVELVKIRDERATGFVNGILRNILRNKDEFNKIGVNNKTKRLSIEYSHPEWFIRKFREIYGEEFIINLMKVNNTPPELTVRANTLKINRDALIKRLDEQGISAEAGRLDESVILNGFSMIEKSDEFNNGYFIFQDESSMLASRILSPEPDDVVIDLCSAPGGKTTHMAQLMRNRGEILAFDIHPHKIELINENAKKLGIEIINAYIGDAAVFNEELADYGNKVLVDAPCSGLGLIRKKPEIRWNITENDIKELQKLQIKILNNASKYLKIDGVLVYSTCTITVEENEEIISEFLKSNTNYKLESICEYLPEGFKALSCENGYVKLFPNENKCDGFFIARLRRVW